MVVGSTYMYFINILFMNSFLKMILQSRFCWQDRKFFNETKYVEWHWSKNCSHILIYETVKLNMETTHQFYSKDNML